jgi:hypothetical protein
MLNPPKKRTALLMSSTFRVWPKRASEGITTRVRTFGFVAAVAFFPGIQNPIATLVQGQGLNKSTLFWQGLIAILV